MGEERQDNGSMRVAVTSSSEHMVEVSTRSAQLKKRTPLEKKIFIVSIVLFIICVIFFIIIIVLSSLYNSTHRKAEKWKRKANTCEISECIDSAGRLLNSMNKSVDPCQNFYDFACGNWRKAHPTPDLHGRHSWFDNLDSRLKLRIRDILLEKNKASDPLPVKQARMLFKSCMDTDRLEELGVHPILDTLEKMELPEKIPMNSTTENFNLARSLALAQRVLSKDIMIGFGVINNERTNKSIIYLTYPTAQSVLPLHGDYDELVSESVPTLGHVDPYKLLRAQVKYVSGVLVGFDYFNDEKLTTQDYLKVAYEILLFNSDLSDLKATTAKSKRGNFERTTFATLQKEMDKQMESSDYLHRIDWKEYLDVMFDGTNKKINMTHDMVYVMDINYVLQLPKMLSNHSIVTIQRHLWWMVVKELASHTTKYMRNLKRQLIEEFIPSSGGSSRSSTCIRIANKLMPMAVSFAYGDESYVNETRKKVGEILTDIQAAFKDLVFDLKWMNWNTKVLTLEKADYVRTHIGVPEWLHTPGKLEKLYHGIDIKNDTYVGNLVELIAKEVRDILGQYGEFGNRESPWATEPLVVNAYYSRSENAITIPIGILNYPFYGLGLQALNYGVIGSILGHELTHGFDNEGRKYDKNGKERDWWNKTTVNEYVERANCFVQQYAKFKIGNDHVNGQRTLGENIADNGGLREALRAYWKYIERNGPEPRLPGLEEYDHDQLLFLGFANLWCEYSDPDTYSRLLLVDPHSPNRFRVLGTLANSKEFSRAWKCPSGSPMNPAKKCQIW